MKEDQKQFIGFYVTPTEKEEIQSAANKERRTVSSYVRQKVLPQPIEEQELVSRADQ